MIERWRLVKPDVRRRAKDERLLRMVGMRVSVGSYVAAGYFGETPEHVRTATNRVRQADLDMSGEDPDLVAAAYRWGS